MTGTGRPGDLAHPQGYPQPGEVARCELTDLLVDQCGCREHRGGHTLEEEHAAARLASQEPPGPWFTANYHGRCTRCDEPFEPGIKIRADGDLGWECCRAFDEYSRSP